MKNSLFLSFILVVVALTATIGARAQGPSGQVFVTNSSDSGAGSFRDAVQQANANPNITRIHFLGRVSTINLLSTVEFTGTQDLTIDGNAATLDGSAMGLAGPAFRATGG